jgi:hypothetical protein
MSNLVLTEHGLAVACYLSTGPNQHSLLHCNRFTRHLSPAARQAAVGMLGIDKQHKQLPEPSIRLGQPNLDHAVIGGTDHESSYITSYARRFGIFRIRCSQKKAEAFVAWPLSDHLSPTGIGILPFLTGLQYFMYPVRLLLRQRTCSDLSYVTFHTRFLTFEELYPCSRSKACSGGLFKFRQYFDVGIDSELLAGEASRLRGVGK